MEKGDVHLSEWTNTEVTIYNYEVYNVSYIQFEIRQDTVTAVHSAINNM
jgi:hypothetical protein